MTSPNTFQLFVYDSLLKGEPEHFCLAGAEFVREAVTEPRFQLVELQGFGALVVEGVGSVRGELYTVDAKLRAALDIRRQVPVLFQRSRIRLADGTPVDSYTLEAQQVRGQRRIHQGDWRARFQPRNGRSPERPIVAWARSRSLKG